MHPLFKSCVCFFLHERTDRNVAQLCFGLTFELRLAKFYRDNCGDAFANVFAQEVVFFFLQRIGSTRVFVDHRGKRSLETFNMHAAFNGGNAVGIAINTLVITGIPLQCDVDGLFVVAALVVSNLGEQGFARSIQVLHKINNSAFVLIGDGLLFVFAFIVEDNF